MNELINITKTTINNEEVNAVNARELWQKLEVKTQFKDWMPRRIDEYGFEEGRDFTVLKNERGKNPVPPRLLHQRERQIRDRTHRTLRPARSLRRSRTQTNRITEMVEGK